MSPSFCFLLLMAFINCSVAAPFFMSDDSEAPIAASDPNSYTDPSEVRAVYEVMVATGNSWVTSIPDVCKSRWHGIECIQDSNGVLHVVSLSFGALSEDTAFPTCDSSTSFISPSIALLPHLRRLFFYRCCSHNPLPIPPQIGHLGASLQSLVLRENGHVGHLPAQLANLTNLHTLDLHGNALTSTIIPSLFLNLPKLVLLDLSNNQLQGQIPEAIDHLTSLKILDLSSNLLQGPIPFEVGAMAQLKKLDVSNNYLSGMIPRSLGQLRDLLLLDLSNNKLSGEIPWSLGQLSNLQTLILENAQMNASIPASLGNLSNLEVLVLSSSQLVGRIPHTLGRLSKLRVLYLDGNKLSGPIPESLGKLEKMKEFNVENNCLSGEVPFSRETVWRLGRRLRLHNNLDLCQHSSLFIAGIDVCEFHPTPPSWEKPSHSASNSKTPALFLIAALFIPLVFSSTQMWGLPTQTPRIHRLDLFHNVF